MKVRVCGLKIGKNFTGGFCSRLLQFAGEYKLTSRFAALLLLTALLSPLFLLESSQTVAAASSSPIISQMPAPVSAPPAAFVLTSSLSSYLSGSMTNNAPAPVIALSTLVSSGYSSVSNYFTAPSVPNGFALAQPASPFVSSVSSAISSFGSFFGFIIPSAKSANTATAGSAAAVAPAAALVSQARGSVSFDFDGDGKADVGRWKPSTKEWKVKQSLSGAYLTWTIGTSSASLIAPGDFDGDGKTDSAIFIDGTWTINKSASGTTQTVTFGLAGDKPMVGDYDGDGTADVAVFRPSDITWRILNSSNGTTTITQFGSAGDIPVAGNYDGDYRTDIAVYRPSNGTWYVQASTDGYSTAQWGSSGDVPVPADYDGDGKTDKAVFRSSVGTWYVYQSSNGVVLSPAWGNYGDQPVPADYDSDGKADFSVWRPTTGVWHIYQSATGVYQSESVGAPGDTAIPSAYLKQIGNQVYSYDFAKTRLSPKNSTGGTDLYSRNFSWGAGLLNLPGRAGLDAGLRISYNSLVWTKDGSTMVFDADRSSVSPGFRLGFPVIEPVYLDAVTGKYNYLMVTPSGAKVEFKQIDATSVFETADSSYAQLVINRGAIPSAPADSLSITVTGTDGTQMFYAWIGNAYRCTQIKDRNGNIISIGNDEYGSLKTITDTLGRVININYDLDLKPISITQNRKDTNGSGATQLHTYATFNYTNVAMFPTFTTGLAVDGPATGNVKSLQSIVYPGGASTRFEYNVFGQVYKVSNHAADDHKLNHTRVNLSNGDLPGAQADCPRFSQTVNYVENFNQDAAGTGQEVVINNTITENSNYTLPGNISGTATKIEVSMPGHPNGAISKTYVGASGWKEGLPLATEDIADAVRKRWTWTDWTQDNTNLTYIQNPRVIESKVGDETNTKRTTVDYGTGDTLRYGLVSTVRVYGTDQSTVLKKSTTAYNLDSAYTSKRIIGLPATSQLFEGESALMSKLTYLYDEGTFGDTTLNQNLTSVIQHDHSSRGYSSTFIVGRGNLTSTTRWNADPAYLNESIVISKLKYNTAGAVVAQLTQDSNNIDPANPTRAVKISYADVFNDNINSLNTFAYPTKITDPAGKFSEVKYRFDTGANVWATSPTPQGTVAVPNTRGKTSERIYDQIGRLERQIIVNNGAYTRYEYPTNGVQSKVFATVTAGMGEAVSESWFDGAGSIRQSRSTLPNGTTTDGWSGTKTEYDILGRVKRQSVPTEVDANWNAAGDDLTRGFLWTSQEYDWKGRVTKQINTDGTFKTMSYEGCGCAGGQVTTLQGEEIIEKDWQGNNPVSLGKRTQKIYADILGRTIKTQVMNWGGISPYTTTINTFNGRDQITKSQHYAGAETSSPAAPDYQETLMTYDGHGRLKTQHRPEQQNANGTPAYTTYNYNADDSIQSVVDARGASSNYTYNTRGLVEQISYTPSTNVPDTPTVTFVYDNAGNRVSMIEDGFGTVTYAYNELSQMTSETRTFTDSLANAPSGGFKLEYDYTLSGQLKFLKDPYGQQINYAYDKVGRLNSVAGAAAFGGITTYASNPQYRAWGGLKSLSYGNQTQMSMTFNNRLQANHYEFNKTGQTPPVMSKNYEYYADGSLRKLDDAADDRFDRLNTYDNLGRPKTGKSGAEARGGTVAQADMKTQLPYRQDYGYNEFNNLTARNNKHWGVDYWYGQSNNLSYSYQNNRITNANWSYDADGRVLTSSAPDNAVTSTYDAKGQLIRLQGTSDINRYYNGDGREAKRKKLDSSGNVEEIKYFIRSSVLGGATVTEAGATGRKLKTIVRAAGATLAWQTVHHYNNTDNEYVNFEQWDASAMSYRSTTGDGSQIYGEGAEGSPAELDPLGGNVGLSTPYQEVLSPVEPEYPSLQNLFAESPMYVNGQRVTATLDGMEVPVSMALAARDNGSAAQCPNNYCGAQTGVNSRGQTVITSPFQAFADGRSGYYVPQWERTDLRVDGVTYRGEDTIGGWEFREAAGSTSSWLLGNSNTSIQTRQVTEPLPTQTIIDTRKLEAALDSCLEKLFGVSLTSFTPSEIGKNGNTNVNFTNPSRRLNGLTGFGVVNDVKTFTRKTMREENNAVLMANGEPPLPKNSTLYGFTRSGSPHTNFTASDERRVILRTQIHELGHSLEYIARPAISGYTQYKEAGWKLEDCVAALGGFKR